MISTILVVLSMAGIVAILLPGSYISIHAAAAAGVELCNSGPSTNCAQHQDRNSDAASSSSPNNPKDSKLNHGDSNTNPDNNNNKDLQKDKTPFIFPMDVPPFP